MTVPVRTSASTRGRTAASRRRGVPPRGRDSETRESGPQRGRTAAVARAYARRAQRNGAGHGGAHRVDAGRTPVVMLVMVLLAAGLVATMWLSTAATADSYHLHSARTDARNLTERSESLAREVATLETAPELARRARSYGMVPAGDAARLVVRPDGGVIVIGQPQRAVAPVSLPAVVSAQLPAPLPALAPGPPPAVPAEPAAPPAPAPAGALAASPLPAVPGGT